MLSRIFAMVVVALTPKTYSSKEDYQAGMEILKDLLLENAVPQHGQTEDDLHRIFNEMREGLTRTQLIEYGDYSMMYVYISREFSFDLIITYVKETPWKGDFIEYRVM